MLYTFKLKIMQFFGKIGIICKFSNQITIICAIVTYFYDVLNLTLLIKYVSCNYIKNYYNLILKIPNYSNIIKDMHF